MMIIKLGKCLAPDCKGASHEWEWEDWTAQEMKRIQKVYGMEVDAFLSGVSDGGVTAVALDAMILMLVLMHRRDGVVVDPDDMDFHLGDIDFIRPDAPEPDEEKPTVPETISLPPGGEPVSSSTSGPDPVAESTPKSSPTPETSGGTSVSPS